jgi:hypothetical protein
MDSVMVMVDPDNVVCWNLFGPKLSIQKEWLPCGITLLRFCRCSCVVHLSFSGASDVLDCQQKSLSDAVKSGKQKDQVISFTGTCVGPIVIESDGLTLSGVVFGGH